MTVMSSAPSDDLRSVLERAQEIESETGLLLQQHPEWKDMIQAAEEAGVPREAILEALRERIGVSTADYKTDELVFATTGNGWYNTARIESTKNGMARVRFLGGGEAEVDLRDVKRFSLAPGDPIYINYYGTWSKMEVGTFNRDSLSVQVSYWGMNENRSLEGVRLKDPRFVKPLQAQMINWAYAAIAAVISATVTAVVMAIVSR